MLGIANKINIDTVRCALTLPNFDALEAQRKMSPSIRAVKRPEHLEGQARLAATLLLLYSIHDRLHFVLTRRPDTFKNHAGQISLPGGRHEAHETYQQTALRETYEEIGIPINQVEILGTLTELYIPPSDFQVYPFVGYLPERPMEWKFDLNEVAEVIECPIDILLDDALKHRGMTEMRGTSFEIFWYQVGQHQVWGATAIMLSELEWRLRECLT